MDPHLPLVALLLASTLLFAGYAFFPVADQLGRAFAPGLSRATATPPPGGLAAPADYGWLEWWVRLFLLLPVVFTLFLLHAASGLVLYWLTSNLVALLLCRLCRISDPDSTEPPVDGPPPAAGAALA